MNNKTVAFLHMTYPKGGAEVVTHNISSFLVTKGYEIYVFAGEITPSKFISQNDRINFITLPEKHIDSKRNRDFIIEKINHHKIDSFIIQGLFLSSIEEMKSKTTCKIVYCHHGMPLWEAKNKIIGGENDAKKSFSKMLEWYLIRMPKYKLLNSHNKKVTSIYQYIYKNTDAFTMLCDEYCEETAKIIGVGLENSKFITLSNPTNISCEPQLTKKKQVLYVGRLTYSDKRVDRLLDIWNSIYKRFPDWELLIIGEGEEEINLKHQAEQLKLENYKFCGYSSNIEKYMQEASILCLISTYEGWPLSLTEAQAYGVIPVAFNCSAGVKTILSPNGVNGVLVEPFHLNEYAKKLTELMSNETLRKAIQHNAIEKAKEYNIENVGKQWEDMFKKLEN